jgi:eukaryotic-like serine/threonine-protein kinase
MTLPDGLDPPQALPTPPPLAAEPTGASRVRPGQDMIVPVSAELDAALTMTPRNAVPATFSSGQLVAGRYMIVRFIAPGGMGEVYEAEDVDLGERVALKTIRPELAKDTRAVERFKREVHFARLVTHPNVCRLYEFGHHLVDDGSEVLFLTMELLRGETLTRRLLRTGPLREAEALPLVRQLASALGAAHRAEVVHRDFKSANVMLVPSAEGLRAVITDFGLARTSMPDDGSHPSLTEVGIVVGTPAYMAPEQFEGHEATALADIYAMGVVLYEMMTGRKPFTAKNALVLALKHMNERPPSPREFAPQLSERWEAAILRCLEPVPSRRFASASELIDALDGSAPVSPPAVHRRTWRHGGVAAAAAVALLLAGAGLWAAWPQGKSAVSGAAAAVEGRRSVAILGFRNLAGRPEAGWLSTALSEMLTTELGSGGTLRMISGETVARMKLELRLAQTETLAPDTLEKIGENLGAELVVLGSFLALGEGAGGQLRLDLKVQDSDSGELVATVSRSGTEGELLGLVAAAGQELRHKLGADVASDAAGPEARAQAALPRKAEAVKLYAQGLERLRLFDALGAKELLEKAAAEEPGSAEVQAALAEAWKELGHGTRSREAARRAYELSDGLARETRLLVEARYREAAAEWDRAIEIYRALFDFYPDNIEHGLRLASAQTAAGRGREALGTIEALRALPAPARGDPRVDLAEADAAESLSDFERQRNAAAHAAGRGPALGASLLVARARMSEWWALRNLGLLNEASAASAEAKQISAEAGIRSGVAQALNATATVLRDRGDLSGARVLDEQSLEIFRELGDQRRVTWALNNLGNGLYSAGDLDGALAAFEESLAICREIGDKSGLARALSNSGRVLQQQGKLAAAGARFEESLALRRAIGEQRGIAWALADVAGQRLAEGELAGAKTAYHEALDLFRKLGTRQPLAYVHYLLGQTYEAEGQAERAREEYAESVAIRDELGERGNAAKSRLAIAGLLLERGQLEEAERIAREARQSFEREAMKDEQASASAVLVRVLLARGRLGEARAMVEPLWPLWQKDDNLRVRLAIAGAVARARAASGQARDLADARTVLDEALTAAIEAGLVGEQLELRLALGELEMAADRRGEGRALLEALAEEAAAKRFGRIARLARAAAEAR